MRLFPYLEDWMILAEVLANGLWLLMNLSRKMIFLTRQFKALLDLLEKPPERSKILRQK